MKPNLQSIVLLYDSIFGAQEVSWMLRAEWDGFNGVTVANSDIAAASTAAALLKINFCLSGDRCLLQVLPSDQSTLKELFAARCSLDSACNHSQVVETTPSGKSIWFSSVHLSALAPGSSLAKITSSIELFEL